MLKLDRFVFFKKGFENPAIIGIMLSILSVLITYSKNWILTRSFSPEEYGYFIYISTIIGWIVTIATSGLNNGVLSYLITFNKKKEYKFIVGWVLGLSIKRGLIGVLIATAFFLLFLSPKSNDSSFLYFSIAVLMPISISISILSSTMVYQGHVVLNNLINIIIINGGTLLFFVFLHFYGFNFYGLALASVLPVVFANFYLTKKTNCVPIFNRKTLDESTKRSILYTSNKILFSGLLYAFWIKAESFFLQLNCGEGCVAYFYVPFQFAFLLTMVNTVMYGVVSSKLAYYEDVFIDQEILYHKSSSFSFYINLLLFFFLYINAFDLLSIFGPIYANNQSVFVIKLLSLSFLLYSYFGATAEVYMNMLNKNTYLLYSAVLTFCISIASNLIFTLNFGVKGAAISFSVTILSTSIIRSYYIRKKFFYKISLLSPVIIYTIISIPVLEIVSYFSAKIDNIYFRVIFSNSILLASVILVLIINYENVLNNFKYFGIKKESEI
jgi:O-antigen/teichoic acid export membrane protein